MIQLNFSIFTRGLHSPPLLFPNCRELSMHLPATELATWFQVLQRAAAFLLCCLFWLAVTSSTLAFQIFWQTEQSWSASAALLYFPHNLPLSLNLQIRAQWAEKWNASWTKVETGDDGNSSQVGEAVWGLPVVIDPNQQGVLLCEGNCEQMHKSVGWWTSLWAYFFNYFFVTSSSLCFCHFPLHLSRHAFLLTLLHAVTPLPLNPPALLTLHIPTLCFFVSLSFLHWMGVLMCDSIPPYQSFHPKLRVYRSVGLHTTCKCGNPLIREQSS